MKRANTARTMEHDAFFLAPAEPVATGFKYEEEEANSQDGGRANSAEDYDGMYDGVDEKDG